MAPLFFYEFFFQIYFFFRRSVPSSIFPFLLPYSLFQCSVFVFPFQCPISAFQRPIRYVRSLKKAFNALFGGGVPKDCGLGGVGQYFIFFISLIIYLFVFIYNLLFIIFYSSFCALFPVFHSFSFFFYLYLCFIFFLKSFGLLDY